MDIFISYSSADRDRVRQIAEALQEVGWSVWWDQVIPPGQTYDTVIEEQVAAAGCIVVAWSSRSIASSWVRAEAGDALNRRILIPVLIEDVEIPLVFRQIHAANLIDWTGGTEHHGFRQLLTGIEDLLETKPAGAAVSAPSGQPTAGSVVPPSDAKSRPASRRRTSRLSRMLAACAIAIAVLGAGSVGWWAWQGNRDAARREALAATPLPEIGGDWDTNFGRVALTQTASEIRGNVTYFNGNRGSFRGVIQPHQSGRYFVLDYNWSNQVDHGDGEMKVYPGNTGSLTGTFTDQKGNTGEWIWSRARQ